MDLHAFLDILAVVFAAIAGFILLNLVF